MPQPTRCGECMACREVEQTKKMVMPNPPFSHASNDSVRVWNTTLAENPCGTWDPETVSNYRLAFDKLSEDIRPRPCDCEAPGAFFTSGVPGIVAHLDDGKLAPDATVERCDMCRRYATDAAALKALQAHLLEQV